MNVLLVGEESAGIHALHRVAESGHRIVGVAASPTPKYGSPVTLWKAAQKLGCRTWAASIVKDPAFVQQIEEDGVDVLLNLHSLHIINEDVIRAAKVGSFNLHPGPLPRYAGLNPVCWALYSGEKTHGVTLHWMTSDVDAGPIVYQCVFPITEEDTGFTVSVRCIKEGLQLVSRLFETLESNPASLPRVPQDLAQRQYHGREIPHGGRIIWSLPARQIVRFVRACDFYPFRSPWGHPRTIRDKLEIQIVKATHTGVRTDAPPGTASYSDACGLVIACGDEWISVSKVKLGDKFLNATEVLRVSDRLETDQWT
jgi:methionyl-tRNA formyltransferase